MTMEWTGRFGVPYQGSKNRIAKDIVSVLPRGRRFVDLFAGGCAMTHAALLSGKYEKFVVNDKWGFGQRLFVDSIAGKMHGRWKEWVSRAEFHARWRADPFIALCWSYGAKGYCYIYGHEVEEVKERLHAYFAEHGVQDYHKWMRGKLQVPGVDLPQRIQSIECEALERLEALEQIGALGRWGG